MKILGTWVNRVPLIILDLFVVNVSIPMIIWIVLIELKRLNCHLKMRFLVSCLVVHAQIQSTHMRLESGMPLGVRPLQIITISICSFLQEEEISALRLQVLSGDDEDGYILEVDIHYPVSLHNQHDDYPLAPESLVIDRSMYHPHNNQYFQNLHLKRNFHPISMIKSSLLFIIVT